MLIVVYLYRTLTSTEFYLQYDSIFNIPSSSKPKLESQTTVANGFCQANIGSLNTQEYNVQCV
jgi:hypothetical protein